MAAVIVLAVAMIIAFSLQSYIEQRDLSLSAESMSPKTENNLQELSQRIGAGSNWFIVNLLHDYPIPFVDLLSDTFQDKWDLYYQRGLTYEELGQYSNAIRDFTEVTKSPRNNSLNEDGHSSYEGYEARASVYAELGLYELAANDIKYLIKVEERYPHWIERTDGKPVPTYAYPPLYLLYAHYLTEAQKPREALVALDDFFHASSSWNKTYWTDHHCADSSHFLRAIIFRKLGKEREALAEWKQVPGAALDYHPQVLAANPSVRVKELQSLIEQSHSQAQELLLRRELMLNLNCIADSFRDSSTQTKSFTYGDVSLMREATATRIKALEAGINQH